jgi:dTDP-4-amino-4,6-dideoxygalactose transaminase
LGAVLLVSPFRVPLSEPTLAGDELKYVSEAIRRNELAQGEYLGRFEERMAVEIGRGHAVACSSGTAALHLALVACGVETGDEVWSSDLTFIAAANAARYCGADVVLIDSERTSWNLDPGVVADELRRRGRGGEKIPVALVVTHLLGQPANIGDLIDVCDHFGVVVIEDAAESLGARWSAGRLSGTAVGAAGRLGCFSFNGNKLVTSGGGGMVVGDDPALLARIRHLAGQAKLPDRDYEHDTIGFNYRLSNVSAALGLAQLERIDDLLLRRRTISDRYRAAFKQTQLIDAGPSAPWGSSSAWLSSALFANRETRDRVRSSLAIDGIESRPVWRPLRLQEPYRGSLVVGGSAAVDIWDRALTLPSSAHLRVDDQDMVITSVLAAASS